MQEKICAGSVCLVADDTGAEPVSIIFDGKERLWQNDNGAWAGHSPLLFPVCGNCEVTIDGRIYPVQRHGFARKARFALAEKRKDYLRYEFSDGEETREVYPFPFKLCVGYRIANDALHICCEVHNTGNAPLVFSLGAHPCFALDGDVDGYEIVFEREERFLHSEHDINGNLTGKKRDFGTGKVFPIPAEELREGRTLIFGNIKSQSVVLRRKTGEQVAEYAFEGYSHLLLWRPEGAYAICIEPWCNLPSEKGDKVEFARRTGVITLAAGECRMFTQQMRFGSYQ